MQENAHVGVPARPESAHTDAGPDGTTAHGRRRRLRDLWLFSGLGPLGLVVLALLGSVVIPARQAWVITSLLHENTEIFGPARLLEANLESGLAEEYAALQGYALLGDTTLLERHRSIVAANDRRFVSLERLALRVDTPFTAHLATARQRVDRWRQSDRALVEPPATRAAFASAVRLGQARYDVALDAMNDLASDLTEELQRRNRRIRGLERFSLVSNLALVLIAFAALYAVAALTLRERRLAASLRHRVDEASSNARQEAALRTAAEELAAASTIDEVMQRIVDAALKAVPGRGAFVERLDGRPNGSADTLTVQAVAGAGAPEVGRSCDFNGSYAERALATGRPVSTLEVDDMSHFGILNTLDRAAGPALAVPLVSRGEFVGALFVLGVQGELRPDDLARAAILGHLSALACERVELLEEAIERRQALERVLTSRSRLIRGFSHDVKNPIGAADGYAALLTEGVYGALNPRQEESLARMRRSIQEALALINDLHELARAETGHLALSPEAVDLAEVVRGITDEYRASANAKGLTLTATVGSDVPIVHTTRARIRQIASNLLSNAIKYTDAGSVTVRVRHSLLGPLGDHGDWVTVEVSDTGRGIPPEEIDAIFDEFRRADHRSSNGAGLGLAISRLIARALGGRITVTSEVGRGSIFTLWLPVRAQQHNDRPAGTRAEPPAQVAP